MSTDGKRDLVDRDAARSFSSEHLADQLEMFDSLVDYGAELVIQLTASHARLEDLIVLGVFLKQVVSMTDSFSTLLREGASHAAYLSARSAFESSLFLEWTIASDSDKKARYFYVQSLRSARSWAQRALSEHATSAEFNEALSESGIDPSANRHDTQEQAKLQVQRINEILAKKDFSEIERHFAKTAKPRKTEPYWYKLLGGGSIRQLSKALGRLAEYEIFYAKAASIHHAATFEDHFRFKDGFVRLFPIRHHTNSTELVQFAGMIAMHSYTLAISKYNPSEMENFTRMYQEAWREPYLSVPSIRYE